jgi:amino acid transporter
MNGAALKPALSLFDSLSIVAGTTIGSGIFIVSARIAHEVHSPAMLLLVWIVASFMSLTGALTIAELAAMMPSTGGQYVFLRESWIPMLHLMGSLWIFVDLLIVKTRYSVLGLLIVSCAMPVYLWRQKRITRYETSLDALTLRPALLSPGGSDAP